MTAECLPGGEGMSKDEICFFKLMTIAIWIELLVIMLKS